MLKKIPHECAILFLSSLNSNAWNKKAHFLNFVLHLGVSNHWKVWIILIAYGFNQWATSFNTVHHIFVIHWHEEYSTKPLNTRPTKCRTLKWCILRKNMHYKFAKDLPMAPTPKIKRKGKFPWGDCLLMYKMKPWSLYRGPLYSSDQGPQPKLFLHCDWKKSGSRSKFTLH
jgi:hypothetical protein